MATYVIDLCQKKREDKYEETHHSSWRSAEVDHVSQAWNNVDCECDEQGARCRVDWSKKREGYGKKPNG